MTEPGERPKWSFTWLLRVQRIGRSHRLKPDLDAAAGERIRKSHTLLLVILIAVVGAETIILVLLDVLPLPK